MDFNSLPEAERWQQLVNCARRALEDNGFAIRRVPGRGRQNVWITKKNGVEKTVCIRTTRDRWIAFPPLGDDEWKTLDDVEEVVVVAVDDTELPKKAEVFIFPAKDVRNRFNDAYKARKKEGREMTLNFGMWVALDARDKGGVNDVGSGIVEHYSPISVFPLEFGSPRPSRIQTAPESGNDDRDTDEPQNVQQALQNARQQIAEITGMPLDKVHLELRIGG